MLSMGLGQQEIRVVEGKEGRKGGRQEEKKEGRRQEGKEEGRKGKGRGKGKKKNQNAFPEDKTSPT